MGSYPLLSQAPTHVEVELGCDNISISQYDNVSMLHAADQNQFSMLEMLSSLHNMSCSVLLNLERMHPLHTYYIIQLKTTWMADFSTASAGLNQCLIQRWVSSVSNSDLNSKAERCRVKNGGCRI